MAFTLEVRMAFAPNEDRNVADDRGGMSFDGRSRELQVEGISR